MKFKYENIFDYYDVLVPTKNNVPQWYKDITRWIGGKPKIYPSRNHTMKHCMPLFDGLTSGYQLVLPYDIMVEQRNGKPVLTWLSTGDQIIKRDSKGFEPMPTPAGFHNEMYAIRIPMSFKLPRGYSVLFTQPMNRFDLVTMTMSAIIDADSEIYSGEAPFFIKENFEGVIEQGTPIAQLLPFKREEWQREQVQGLNDKANINRGKSTSVLSGWYKNNIWKRKSYD